METFDKYKLAAVVCDLIDLLDEVAKDKTLTADDLRQQITDIKEQKNILVSDHEECSKRHAALSMLDIFLNYDSLQNKT